MKREVNKSKKICYTMALLLGLSLLLTACSTTIKLRVMEPESTIDKYILKKAMNSPGEFIKIPVMEVFMVNENMYRAKVFLQEEYDKNLIPSHDINIGHKRIFGGAIQYSTEGESAIFYTDESERYLLVNYPTSKEGGL